MYLRTHSPILALLLASGALSAVGAPDDAVAPAGRVQEQCRAAILRNGFIIEYARSEPAGTSTRLWLCGDSGTGYLEVSSNQIDKYEDLQIVASPTPAVPASSPESLAGRKPPTIEAINKLISGAAWRYQIDPDFVTSVVRAESGFNPHAVSPKGAKGLMQLMPQTAVTLGVGNVLDPASNLEGGTKYLRQLLDQYKGDVVKALSAYNAGPLRVQQYGGMPPYSETRAYVTRIVDDYNRKKTEQPGHQSSDTPNK